MRQMWGTGRGRMIMFCLKCGKQIDGDSKFCPFCGNTIEYNSLQKETANKGSSMQGSIQDMEAGRQKGKKRFPVKFAACGAVAVVVLVVACVFMFRNFGNEVIEKSFLGRMFSLSWDEISDMTARDFRNLLNEEDILYDYMEESYSDLWGLVTQEVSEFMGSDSVYTVVSSLSGYAQRFIMFYETRDDCRDSYENIASYLDKNLAKNTMAVDMMSSAVEQLDWADVGLSYLNFPTGSFPTEQMKGCMFYLMEECAEADDIDKYLDLLVQNYGEDILDSMGLEEVQEELGEYAVYKVVNLSYGTNNDMEELLEALSVKNNSYSNDMCIAEINFVLAKKSDYIRWFTMLGWDSISGKEIDIEKFKKSLDADFCLSFGSDDRNYYAIYMLEKYNFDIYTGHYIDKEDKNFWYITNCEYDMDKGKTVDLSNYMDSTKVYCALEYNYNVDEIFYFENDFDKALYLVNLGYNSETGGRFGSKDEKRLWFMKNYGYDIVAEKEVSKKVGEALGAYSDFISTFRDSDYWPYDRSYDPGFTFNFYYVDDDDVPELYIKMLYWGVLFGYKDGQVVYYVGGDISPKNGNDIGYIKGAGKLYFRAYGSDYGYATFYDVQDGMLTITDSCDAYYGSFGDDWAGSYSINDQKVDGDKYGDMLNQMLNGYVAMQGEYKTIFSAYDAARTSTYYANLPEIEEFELSKGVLTVSTNDGSRYGWYASTPFSFSYPVADDCVWEQGWYESDFVKDKDISYEDLKATITSEFERYENLIKNNGEAWFIDNQPIESPLGIQITVTDGVVVSVRVTGS